MAGEDEEHHPFWNHDRSSYDINSKIMVIAIVSLSAVVVLVILLHIYARCVLRRQAQRRAILRRLGQHPVSPRLHVNGSEPQPPKTGLDASVIASLPIFIFKQVDPNDENSSLECAVCLSMLERDEMARVLPNCNHTFHAECIDKWLGSHSTCPICRTEAEPKVEPQAAVEAAAAAAATASTGGLPPTAPPLEITNMEGTSSSSAKVVSGSSSRLSSFRRMLSREKSSRRMQSCSQDQDHHGIEDLERQ